MKKICIFSSDILFARMLMHELKLLCVTEDAEVLLNDESIPYEQDPSNLLIVDLDGSYADSIPPSATMIGFTRKVNIPSKKALAAYKEIFHRPFNICLLNETVLKIIKDSSAHTEADESYPAKNEKIIFCERDSSIRFRDHKIHLSKNEFNVLALLNQKKGTPVSRSEINTILDTDMGNMCDVYICKLRAKLSDISSEKFIYTVRNKGYMLKLNK